MVAVFKRVCPSWGNRRNLLVSIPFFAIDNGASIGSTEEFTMTPFFRRPLKDDPLAWILVVLVIIGVLWAITELAAGQPILETSGTVQGHGYGQSWQQNPYQNIYYNQWTYNPYQWNIYWYQNYHPYYYGYWNMWR